MAMQNIQEFNLAIEKDLIAQNPQEASAILENTPTGELVNKFAEYDLSTICKLARELSVDTLLPWFKNLSKNEGVTFLTALLPEKAARILSCLDKEQRTNYSKKLPRAFKRDIADIEKYPQGTAGHLMDRSIIVFTPDMTVNQAIKKIKDRKKKGIRVLFITTPEGKLDSMLAMQELIMAEGHQHLKDIARSIPARVSDMDPQEEIVTKLEQFRLTDIPVEDINGVFVGVVRHHALIKVTHEELTKDIQKMVGVSEDEKALSKVTFSVRKRLPWLEINLLTAFLAASVVGLFESTIAQYTALAVLLPVVAGQSGNTGAQALAVTMRGLSLKEIRPSHWFIIVFKELRISIITGCAVAITTALGVLWWSKSWGLTLIIGLSMVLSMVLASMSGALVPIILKRLNQDPASSSSIILTTVTDVCGFFSFLGIATLLSRFI